MIDLRPRPWLALAVLPLALAGCSGQNSGDTAASPSAPAPTSTAPESPAAGTAEPSPSAAETTAAAAAPGGTISCTYPAEGDPARPVDPPSTDGVPNSGTVDWTMTTNQGDVTITMDRAKTPCTVHSFESLAQQGFYNDTQCHRLVDSGIFVLQCGDPTGTGRGGPGYSFPDEVTPDAAYPAGTVAMANAGANTNGSQFFLVYADTKLPPNYTVFGEMDQDSLGVVARIAAEGQDGSNPDGSGKPNNEAKIVSVTKKS